MKVFVNASLSSIAEQRLNKEITNILDDLGFDSYLPQETIPPGSSVSPVEVFETNRKALTKCDIVLSVLDKPGLGVIFELGYAMAIGKPLVLFRSDVQDYLGKVVEGLWGSHLGKRASSLEELREIMRNY